MALILQILERVLHQNEEINKKWGNARSEKQAIQRRRGVEGISERIKGKCQRDWLAGSRKHQVQIGAETQRAPKVCVQKNMKRRVPGMF